MGEKIEEELTASLVSSAGKGTVVGSARWKRSEENKRAFVISSMYEISLMQPQKKPRANALLADFWELATQFAETQGQGRSLLTFRLLKQGRLKGRARDAAA